MKAMLKEAGQKQLLASDPTAFIRCLRVPRLISIPPTGTKLASFYAFRMGIRALNGCRTTYQSTTSDSNLLAITMKDAASRLYLLVTNSARQTSYTVTADMSALITNGQGTMWQFDAMHDDVIVGTPMLNNDQVRFAIPGTAAVLITF